MKYVPMLFAVAMLLSSCGQPDSIVEPGPSDTDTATTVPEEDSSDEDESNSDEVVTDAATTTTPADTETVEAEVDGDVGGGAGSVVEGAVDAEPAFVVDESSENAAVFTELGVSGLVLSLDEQACADEAAVTAVDEGSSELNAIIAAVQACATPAAIDDFSAELIIAGGAPLPPTEAACVSSRLQSGEAYQPFWAALLETEPFDFLVADTEVQNRFLDLYTECVSIGRALGQQVGVTLSEPTVGCVDGLYEDREFVRVTIEADLSGNVEDQARVNDQIAGCLTSEERSDLGIQ